MKKMIIVICIILCLIFTGLTYYTQGVWWPGLTPEASAKILINDRKFGTRALHRAMNYKGDQIILELKAASDNFSKLGSGNSYSVSLLLAARNSPASINTARELYSRENDFSFLVGAFALASHKLLDLNHTFKPESRILSFLKKHNQGIGSDSEEILALRILKKIKDQRATPTIITFVNETKSYHEQEYGFDTLGEIGGPNAELALVDTLKNPSIDAFPAAFRALIKLNNINAIPLAINILSSDLTGRNSEKIIEELEKATGENFGLDKDKWERWWSANQTFFK